MGRLEDNIRLIRNERNEGGNTKERVAETFDLVVSELNKKAGKEEGKGLSTNDFTNEHKNKLEGLQQVDTSGLLQKGAYTGNASDLAAGIDKKVDKVAGKGLSTNDYTDAEKQKNEANAKKQVVNITVTGDVNKIITITFADSTVIQAPFKDNDHTPLADVHLNSMNFDENTGVLTGVKSDGEVITVSLDGRYSLIGHNHDEQYAPKTHHHNEYALHTHRHNKDDIDGLPANIATTNNIKTAIEGIQIGGRNYLGDSSFLRRNLFYCGTGLLAIDKDSERISEIHSVKPNQNWVRIYKEPTNIDFLVGQTVTVSFDVKVLEGDLGSPKFYAGSFSDYFDTKPINGNLEIGKWKRVYATLPVNGNSWLVHLGFSHLEGKYQLRNFKLETGNKPTDWSPAPEDLATHEQVMQKVTRTGYEVGTDMVIPQAQQNDTVFVKASCTLGLQNIEHLGSVSFIKTFDNGAVTFTCAGKNIIYPFDNTFNGKKGSTAVVSIHNNDCYIRISNV